MCRCIVVYFTRCLLFYFIFTTVCLWPKFTILRCYRVFPFAKHLCLLRDPICHYVPLCAPTCPYMPYVPPQATMCPMYPMYHYTPLCAPMSQYMPLHAPTCHYVALCVLWATTCPYEPLLTTMSHHVPLCATTCRLTHLNTWIWLVAYPHPILNATFQPITIHKN